MSGAAPKVPVYPGHPDWRKCSATIFLDYADTEIDCELQDGHEGDHEHSSATEFGKHWTLHWSNRE